MATSSQSFDTECSPKVSGTSPKCLLHVFKYTFGGQAVMPTPSFHTPSLFFLCCLVGGQRAGEGREWPQKPCQAVQCGGTPCFSPSLPSLDRTHARSPTHPSHAHTRARRRARLRTSRPIAYSVSPLAKWWLGLAGHWAAVAVGIAANSTPRREMLEHRLRRVFEMTMVGLKLYASEWVECSIKSPQDFAPR